MKLRVNPDFGSSGIWYDDGMMAEYEELNMPPELVKAFETWIEFFDRDCHDRANNYRFNPEKGEELNRRGRGLAFELKKLYPNYDIVYVGEMDCKPLHEEVIDLPPDAGTNNL